MIVSSLKQSIQKRFFILFLWLLWPMVHGCEDFVEVDPPNNQLTGEVVFENPRTVDAALMEIHARLRDRAFTNGSSSGLANLLGHYADEFNLVNPNLPNIQFFYENNLLATDSNLRSWWASAYELIYAINRILEGVASSGGLTADQKGQFMGEAYFLRAFLHFYLSNLYGEIPYPLTSDYETNRSIKRLGGTEIYHNLFEDLKHAKELLPREGNDAFRPSHWAASALLARVYLYYGEWDLAQQEGEYVIQQGNFQLESLDRVFLKDSRETLWQLDVGTQGNNTREAFTFIFSTIPPPNSALSPNLIESMEEGDGRFGAWVGSLADTGATWYFPFKYKQNAMTDSTEECSILLRLAELYLIVAEAYVQQGEVAQGVWYLNAVRSRAFLPDVVQTDGELVLEAILQERRIELFSELGHRFFDLKRTDMANEILAPLKPNWTADDLLLPLPESELLLNPNLLPQNEGY